MSTLCPPYLSLGRLLQCSAETPLCDSESLYSVLTVFMYIKKLIQVVVECNVLRLIGRFDFNIQRLFLFYDELRACQLYYSNIILQFS